MIFFQRCGYVINVIRMDQAFDKVKDKIEVEINTTAARDHVGEIERSIISIKERARATSSDIPYKTIPKQVVIHMVYFCIMWMNSVPNKLGISQAFSPQEIMTRHKLNCKKHCKASGSSWAST